MSFAMKTVGVLSIQGAFPDHIEYFEHIIKEDGLANLQVIAVTDEQHLKSCDSLVIPGGESSAISLTAQKIGLWEPLMEFVKTKPVWGTCAGLILLSSKITNAIPQQEILGGLDIEVRRNAFGRQLDSFIQELDFSCFIGSVDKFPAVFIRAPVVSAVGIERDEKEGTECGVVYAKGELKNKEKVEILSRLGVEHDNLIVAIRQGNKLGTSFHPELSGDYLFHRWFLQEFVFGGL